MDEEDGMQNHMAGTTLKVSRLPLGAPARQTFPKGEIYIAIERDIDDKYYFALDLYQAIELAKALISKVEAQLKKTVIPWDPNSFEVVRR